jgi:hypothetical protein
MTEVCDDYLRAANCSGRDSRPQDVRTNAGSVRQVTARVRESNVACQWRASYYGGWWWCCRPAGGCWARRGETRRTTAGRRGTPRRWTRARKDEEAEMRQCGGEWAARRGDEERDAEPVGEDGGGEAADASEGRRGRAVQRSSCRADLHPALTHRSTFYDKD